MLYIVVIAISPVLWAEGGLMVEWRAGHGKRWAVAVAVKGQRPLAVAGGSADRGWLCLLQGALC